MRILFYLPVVTPWWFETIIVPLVRACARDAEVHVIVPPLWSGTGIGVDQLMQCADLEDVAWHIWDTDYHEDIRTSAAADKELLALIRDIDADYTLCRSADVDTPQQFPGQVRFLMEGIMPTLPCPAGWLMLPEGILDAGTVPALETPERELLERDFAPLWERLNAHWRERADPAGRALFCERAGIPADKRIIAMPLEYEHHENFFLIHRRFESNVELVREVAERLDDGFVLAVTDHPLNVLHAKAGALALRKLARELEGKLVIVPDLDGPRTATEALLPHSEGVVLGDTKSIAVAAYFGIPIHRRSRFASAPWMNVYEDFDAFLAAVRAGEAKAAAPDDVRLWFAYHVANNVLDIKTGELSATDVLDHFDHPVSPARLAAGRVRFDRLTAALAEAA